MLTLAVLWRFRGPVLVWSLDACEMQADVALFFAICPAFYILFAFPAGTLCDRRLLKHKYLLGIGCIGLSVAFCSFTSPWSPNNPALLACGLSNVLFGAASTLVTVPQMPDLQQDAARQLPCLSEEGTKRRTNLVTASEIILGL
jgi:MFS family permease